MTPNQRFINGALKIEGDGPERYEPTAPVTCYRHAAIEERVAADGTLALSFSSEEPVMRWGEAEILLHENGAANISRLMQVGAVLRNHDPDQIVGRPVEASIDAGSRKGRAKIAFGTTPRAQEARQEVADGTLRGVSVGYIVKEWMYLKDATETWQRFAGPAWIATKWDVLEISLTPVPADPSVGVGRTQTHAAAAATQEGRDMDGKQDTKPAAAPAVEPAAPPPVAERKDTVVDVDAIINKRLADERARVSELTAMQEKYGVDLSDMIRSGASVDAARKLVLETLAARQAAAPKVEVVAGGDGAEKFVRAAVAGLCERARLPLDAEDTKCGIERKESLLDLAKTCLRRRGLRVPDGATDVFDLAMRGQPLTAWEIRHGETISSSTSDLPYVLAAAVNKAMLAGVKLARTTYQLWCRIGTVGDFKAFTRIRLSESTKLAQVNETAGYTTANFADRRESGTVVTYGKAFNVSRQMLVNDDLQALTDIPRALGRAAALVPNDLAVTLLLANGNMSDSNPLFHANHANLSGSANYKFDTLAHAKDGLANAIKLMYQQKAYRHATPTAAEDMFIGVDPKILLMPPTGMQYGFEALAASGFFGASSVLAGVDANWLKQFQMVPAVEPNLESSKLSGYSTTAWYLFADPNIAPVMEVTFLNGVSTPYMEEMENTGTAADGRVYKVRLDCTATKVDWLGAVKEAGA